LVDPTVISTDFGDQEGVFAADQIADASEDQRAERAHQEASCVSGKGREQRRGVVAGRKEQLGEERRERRIEIKIVPLEHRAEGGGGHR
jgi:hypothetical protein